MEYFQTLCLCLAQQASIMRFNQMVENYSRRIARDRITPTLSSALTDIQERFLAFQGQLCFDDVSTDEQMVELYGMTKKRLLVDEKLSVIKERISALYEVANMSSGSYLNVIATVFALVSVALSITAMKFSTVSVSDVVYYENDVIKAADKANLFIRLQCVAIGLVLLILIAPPIRKFCIRILERCYLGVGKFFTSIIEKIKKIFHHH
jgi:hypothetical protein